ncbi:hypothetical protein ACMFMF_002509 [Clarireedia jacksonii]
MAHQDQELAIVSDDGFTSRTNVWTGNKCVTYEDRQVISVDGVHNSEPSVSRPAERSRKDKFKNALQAPLYAFGRVVDDTKTILCKSPIASLGSRSRDPKRHSIFADPTAGDGERGSRKNRDWCSNFKSKNGLVRIRSMVAIKMNWSTRRSQVISGATTSANPNKLSAVSIFSRSMNRHERAISPKSQVTLEVEQQESGQKQELYYDIGMQRPRDRLLADAEDHVEQQKTLTTELMNACRSTESSELYKSLETKNERKGVGDINYKDKALNNGSWQGQDGALEERDDNRKEAVLDEEYMVQHNRGVQIRENEPWAFNYRMKEVRNAMQKVMSNNRSPIKHSGPSTEAFPEFYPHDFTQRKNHLVGEHFCGYHRYDNYDRIQRPDNQACSHSTCVSTCNDTDSEAGHEHPLRFWAQPEAFGYHIEGNNPECDNPFLHWNHHQEIQEWTSTTAEFVPEHVCALTTAELKQLHGATVRFDSVRKTYKTPANTPETHSSHSEIWEEPLIDDAEPKYNRKDLTKLLGVPNPQYQPEELQVDTHFQTVADCELCGFDLGTNCSDYYGVQLFDSSPDTWLETHEGIKLENEESTSEFSEVENEQVNGDEHLSGWRGWNSLGAGTTEESAEGYIDLYVGAQEESWTHHEHIAPERYSDGHERYTETAASHADDCTSFTATEPEQNELFEGFLRNVILPGLRARERRGREEQIATISVSSEDLESVSGSNASHETIAADESTVFAAPHDQSETLSPETLANSLASTSSTASSPTRSYPARPQVPAQSLILHLRGRGLSIHSIAVLISPLSAEFLYDSDSQWLNGFRIPDHPSFDDRIVQRILETCDAGTPWWEGKFDDEGWPLPEGFRVLQRRMRVDKAEKLVKKCLENYFYWRLLRTVVHPTLMVG